MAKIVQSDTAPSESVRYSLAGAEFELGGGKGSSFETKDPAVLGDAETHPWLRVEREKGEIVQGEYRDYLAPEDDALSAVNSVANDPEEARKALPSAEDEDARTAIQAGRDQDQTRGATVGGIAETIAADAANDDKHESKDK